VTTLHLLRHAQTTPPTGTTDVPLSTQGRDDAKALVPVLQSLQITRIVSSPCLRAIETIQPFLSESNIKIETDVRLREREMPFAKSPQEHIKRVQMSFQNQDFAPEGGESFLEASARALACLKALTQEGRSGLLLVGHGQCLTLILRAFDRSADFDFWSALPTPALVELNVHEGQLQGDFRRLETNF